MALCEALDNYNKKFQSGKFNKDNVIAVNVLQEVRSLRLMVRHLKRDVRDVSEILEGITL